MSKIIYRTDAVSKVTERSDKEKPEPYIALEPDYLYPDKACDFPIYLYNEKHKRYVLYKSEDAPIQQDQLDALSHEGTRAVYVPQTYSFQVNRFIAENLTGIVENPHLPLEQKTEKFHAIASTVMKSLFESPPDKKKFVETSKQVGDSLAALIVQGPEAVYHLNQLRSYDYYTYSHSMNVCAISVGLYCYLHPGAAKEKIMDLTRGVLLHDIGKCDIPPELTNKPGPLTDEEWEIMRSHTVKGFESLEVDSNLSEDSRLVALYHHETMDGNGYPEKLKGDQIPLTSRICKVVDIYDALTSRRSYKDGQSPFEALAWMRGSMKLKVDQDILKELILFLKEMGKLT